MSGFYKSAIFLLRTAFGWLFFYSGITKIQNPNWTAKGYLENAGTFSGFYNWLAHPSNIQWINFLNEWGMLLIGISLILGLFVKYSSIAGILMMVLYYFPVFEYPAWGNEQFVVDQHVIYILVFMVLMAVRAGQVWGLDKYVRIRK